LLGQRDDGFSRPHARTVARVLRFALKESLRAVRIAAAIWGLQSGAAAQVDELSPLSPDKVRIEYRAPAECPDSEAFKALVGSRAPAGWQAAPDQVARRVIVEISGNEGQYAATVELVDERGERVAQTLSGALCSNVVDGIALVTALAIQSRGTQTEADGEPVVAPQQPQSTPAPAASEPAGAAPAPRVTLEAAQPARALGVQRRAANLRVGGRIAIRTGVGPNVAPGMGLGVVFEPRGARVGLALQAFRTPRVEVRGVPVRFDLLSARVDGCPFVVTFADWASLEPCPFAEFGVVTGQAFEAAPAVLRGDRGSAPWYSAGAAGRVVGRFGSVVVELEALLGVPLRRERFHIERGDEVHRMPIAYGAVAAGLGVPF
jgi:hypothetical protein